MRAANICHNVLPMNKELICPAECYAIRGAIYEVHNEMGSGFREEVYQQCLERELTCRGMHYDAKKELRIYYKGVPIEKTYIPDFLCYGKIIVEIKAAAELAAEHRAQLMNYLRLTHMKMGLLVNFASYPKATVEQWVLLNDSWTFVCREGGVRDRRCGGTRLAVAWTRRRRSLGVSRTRQRQVAVWRLIAEPCLSRESANAYTRISAHCADAGNLPFSA